MVSKIAPPLNGIKKGTFVYHTIKDRWPSILTQVIDRVHRYNVTHTAVHAEVGDEDIKAVIHELSEMKYHMQTDKPLRDLDDRGENHSLWNDHLNKLRKEVGEENVTWYKAAWLFVECYLYRRIAGSFFKRGTLTNFDPFTTQKQNAFVTGLPVMESLAKETKKIVYKQLSGPEELDAISRMIQVCLWGNKYDLSLSGGKNVAPAESPLEQVDKLAGNIILNDIRNVVEIIINNDTKRIDFALDNAGLELFGDLLLADFLLLRNKASKVVFHGKSLPWFVSDVTNDDFFWVTEMVIQSSCDEVKEFGMRWKERLENGSFEFHAHPFWTSPFDYSEMKEHALDLYQNLSLSGLLIFKGDLHYRKLVGDREWPLDFPFKEALRGFNPAPLIALRTLKAETQAGLTSDVIKSLEKKYDGKSNWMVTGDYAVAQLCK